MPWNIDNNWQMDYQTSFSTSADRKISFYAITKAIDQWWGKVDCSADKIGNVFSVYFGNTEWRFEIRQYVPFEKVQCHCIKAYHFHFGVHDIQEEWLHTDVLWDIAATENDTMITMTHKGLHRDLNFYDVCKSGWDYFIATSLKNYSETGTGNPHFE